MFDPTSAIVGGGLLAGGYLAGLVSGLRRRRVPRSAPTATCTCGHALSLHDLSANTCEENIRLMNYLRDGTRNGWTYEKCKCRQYIGPRPVEELFGPDYLPPSAGLPFS